MIEVVAGALGAAELDVALTTGLAFRRACLFAGQASVRWADDRFHAGAERRAPRARRADVHARGRDRRRRRAGSSAARSAPALSLSGVTFAGTASRQMWSDTTLTIALAGGAVGLPGGGTVTLSW